MRCLIQLSFCALVLMLLNGCATTKVTKNPGECDDGVRFYRPKPYLFLQPTKGESQEFVSMTLQYLPDFTEEYSIKVQAGLGVNNTTIKLSEGWNLTEINQELDSKFNENVAAVGDLVSKFVKTSDTKDDQGTTTVVRANNVPFGYYESIISRGPDCKKRLYGWRYVGFYPFNSCPTESAGGSSVDCSTEIIYGLAFEQGVMTFKPLNDVSTSQDLDRVSVQDVPPIDEHESAIQTIVKERIDKEAWGATVEKESIDISLQPNKVYNITIPLPKPTFEDVNELEVVTALNPDLTHAIQSHLGNDISYTAMVDLQLK